ncbi:anti-sigma factor [Mangrovimonas sp. CR14]|uniref:anti-sigma factor n=1 Tax=Mangrovimonas sp. CR14 TaxID=2706120 RepID=UPI00141EED4E|nr:anti-sigma factor [Mangrovimonas sp. CR14]NIK92828.1 anti-sigma factor [Mangrovimonas sp. CR14]
MNEKELIESGILELYVAGALSDQENEEVYNMLLKSPEVLSEVLKIEASIISLTAMASPSDPKYLFASVKEKLGLSNQVVPIRRPNTRWMAYTGWAASILLFAGLIWLFNQKQQLESDIQTVETEKELIEVELEKTDQKLVETKQILSIIRDKNVISIPLSGQAVYPEAYAKAYWDKDHDKVYFDLQGLPTPPSGKVYQIWSLTLTPLTPTSLGTIDDFTENENKIFTLENIYDSEAFGITLEPAGGSESPTMDQLYTLGAVETNS